ncbi:hypothetical protein E2C01_046579 [Portunus trituberculatus]|uniref:Uncharacterized protein n=1 Tax=Portunus trituberculatus TaxID=210409 RepID=A0A5B7G643_PORTR|nr:hypothetical protein [Portunus trituberculatus]
MGRHRERTPILGHFWSPPQKATLKLIYSSATEARLRVLDSVHHAGVRLATGVFWTSPVPSLLMDAGFWPLDLRRQSSLLRCWFRIHRLPDSVPCVSILQDSRSQVFLGMGKQALPKRRQVALQPLPLSRFEMYSSVFV